MTVKLDAHLREIDHAANEMFAQLTKQRTAAEGVTEALKQLAGWNGCAARTAYEAASEKSSIQN